MGKNKKKVNSVFKVAGAKSLKLKAKAKAVKSELKHINIKNKAKITEIDKALVQLQDEIRHTADKKNAGESNITKLPTVNNAEALETQKKSEETVIELDNMQL